MLEKRGCTRTRAVWCILGLGSYFIDIKCFLTKYLMLYQFAAASSDIVFGWLLGLLLKVFRSDIEIFSSSRPEKDLSNVVSIGAEGVRGIEVGIIWEEANKDCTGGNSREMDMSEDEEGLVCVWWLLVLYMSCKSRITDASPTVSLKKNISIVDVRIILSKGMASNRRPNLVGCLWYRLRT